MKLLVCYDKRNKSLKAIDIAVKRAKQLNAFVYLVTSSASDASKADIAEAESKLDYYADEEFKKNEVSCETHLLIRGLTPGEDIVQFAKEKKVDEIIIGIKKRSKLGKIVFGSTAQFVILEAPCPVLTLK